MKTAIELIAAERERQMQQEGWTPEHDDQHGNRELASAALGYVGHYVARAWTYTNELGMPGVVDGPATYREEQPPDSWPWDEEWWKPKDPMRDLVRAAALIAAEIDRLQRKASAPNNPITCVNGKRHSVESSNCLYCKRDQAREALREAIQTAESSIDFPFSIRGRACLARWRKALGDAGEVKNASTG